MNKTQIVKTNNKELFFKCSLIALVLTIFVTFAASNGMLVALAGNGAVNTVVNNVTNLIKTAAIIVGAVIAAWGIFQMILAFRREDSEGISKQITTVVVGALLIGFGATVQSLLNTLMAGI